MSQIKAGDTGGRWPARPATAAVIGVILGVTLAGCGSRATRVAVALPRPCRERGVVAVGRVLGVRAARVSAAAAVGDNGFPECRYGVGRASVTVNVDSGAQPYFRLERAQVELAQQFGSARTALEVDHVPGLGLDGFWLPAEHEVMTTDGSALLTAAVSAPPAVAERLGVAAARAHLGRIVPPPGFDG